MTLHLPALDRLAPGDHVCHVYDDDEQRLSAVARFVHAGARGGNRVVHYCAGSPGEVTNELTERGVDAGTLHDSGALRLYATEESYLASGSFDPEAVLDGWRQAIVEALDEGYAGLWVLGDMAWAADSKISGAERLPWYEAEVNRIFSSGHALAVCLYDQRAMPVRALDRIRAAHPSRLGPGEQEGWAPLLRMRRTTDPPGLVLTGEADASNREALAATLAGLREDLPDAAGPLTVDMSGLRFADAAVIRLLVETDRALPWGIRLTGCTLPVARLLRMFGGAHIPGARVEASA